MKQKSIKERKNMKIALLIAATIMLAPTMAAIVLCLISKNDREDHNEQIKTQGFRKIK